MDESGRFTRCPHVVGRTKQGQLLVCPGQVAWESMPDGREIGRCGECGREWVDDPRWR